MARNIKQTPVTGLIAFEQVLKNKKHPILNELNLRLFSAVMMGTEEDVSKVIEEGADVNALNLNQLSPLDLAKAYQRKDIMKILEEHGAQVHHSVSHELSHKKKKPTNKK